MYSKHILIFNKLSHIYEKLGDDIRATAYHNLSKRLELGNLEGISKKSMDKIKEIDEKGYLTLLRDLERDKDISRRLRLTEILGVGPKLAEELVRKKIYTFSEFKKLENHTQLQNLGIKYYNKVSLPSVRTFKKIIEILKRDTPNLKKLEIAGSYRTGNKSPNDIDLIVCTHNGEIEPIIKILEEKKLLLDYVKSGKQDLLGFIKISDKIYRIDIKCTVPKYFYSYLLYFGSGKYFSKYIRGVAKERGYKLNQYGIVDLKTGEMKTFKSEKSIFSFLGLDYYSPEERVKYF